MWTAISPYLSGQCLCFTWRSRSWIPSGHYCGVYEKSGYHYVPHLYYLQRLFKKVFIHVFSIFYAVTLFLTTNWIFHVIKACEYFQWSCFSHLLVLLIQAKMDNQVIEYKDLAAIPKDKAILDIERPDLMMYQPHFSYLLMDHSEVKLTTSIYIYYVMENVTDKITNSLFRMFSTFIFYTFR